MNVRAAVGRSKTLTAMAILLAMVAMLSITACRDSEPPPKVESDETPVDRSGERRRQAHRASEGGPQRTGSDNEPAYQGPAGGGVGAEGYKPPSDAGNEETGADEAEEDEEESKLREP